MVAQHRSRPVLDDEDGGTPDIGAMVAAGDGDALVANEKEILDGLFYALDYAANHTESFDVKVGPARFKLVLRPLSADEKDKCREEATRYSRERGMRTVEGVDLAEYQARQIYVATVNSGDTWDREDIVGRIGAIAGQGYKVVQMLPDGLVSDILQKVETLSLASADGSTQLEVSKN